MNEISQIRDRIITEALSWLGTPYRPSARVKHGGCDCGTFLLMVLFAVGLVTLADAEGVEPFAPDAWAHWKTERYLLYLMKHGKKVLETVGYPTFRAKPGDIVVARVAGSNHYNHGGIVIAWPKIIHSVNPEVCITNVTTDPLWSFREIAWFDVTEAAHVVR